jgi:hypothetical protein
MALVVVCCFSAASPIVYLGVLRQSRVENDGVAHAEGASRLLERLARQGFGFVEATLPRQLASEVLQFLSHLRMVGAGG